MIKRLIALFAAPFLLTACGTTMTSQDFAETNPKLILEEYFGEYDRNKKQDLASVAKSIGSILIGIAMDKGFIEGIAQGGLEKNVLKLFPEHEGTINENLRKQKILLKHIY